MYAFPVVVLQGFEHRFVDEGLDNFGARELRAQE